MLATNPHLFNQQQVLESKYFTRLFQTSSEGRKLEFLGNRHLLVQSASSLFLIDSKTGTLLQRTPDCSQFAFSKQEMKVVVLFKDAVRIFQYSPTDHLSLFKSIKINMTSSLSPSSSTREAFLQIHDLIFLVADQSVIRIFSLETLQLLSQHPLAICQNIVDVKFRSEDCLILAEPSGLVNLFEPSTGSLVAYLQVASPISALAIHPSVPDLLAVGCSDGNVMIYDLKAPQQAQKCVAAHYSTIWQIRFFANTVWTASEDGAVTSCDFTDPGASNKLLRFSNPTDMIFGLNAFDLDVERQVLFFVGDSGVISSGSFVFE